MSIRSNRNIRATLVASLLAGQAAQAFAAYNPAYCQSVAGTLNIHWQAIAGPYTPCTGVEFTNGTFADAADGSVTMAGTSVSNTACIGTAAYTLTLTPSTFQLVGSDTAANVPMTLTRFSGNDCFVGTWSAGADVYEAYIWAAAFPLASTIPAVGAPQLALLAALLGMAGAFFMRRRKER